MTLRKYYTEFGLNMFSDALALLQQDQLESDHLKEAIGGESDFHIYIIARRPRVALDPSTLKWDEKTVSGVFTIQKRDQFERHEFTARNDIGRNLHRIHCPYPHSEFAVLNPSGKRIAGGKVALLLSQIDPKFWELMDLEVLYIGQAYGENGSRVAPDRLKSHSTLQAIYAEALRESPDQEVWIILCKFEPYLITSWDGTEKNYQTTTEEDTNHAQAVRETSITEQQQINLTEAALIRYFQPPYNERFKDTFPSPAHSTYSECYDLDLNAINVELQNERLRVRLWSKVVAPQWNHFATFHLHSREDRKGMFDLLHVS